MNDKTSTTKTPAAKKPTAKRVTVKAPVAKPAAKKAAPVKQFAAGARVKVTRKTGEVVNGRVVKQYVKATGPFVTVDIGVKGSPNEKSYRLPNVKGY